MGGISLWVELLLSLGPGSVQSVVIPGSQIPTSEATETAAWTLKKLLHISEASSDEPSCPPPNPK